MVNWFRRTLRPGDDGPEVDIVNRKLKIPGAVYGEDTAAKVRGLQRSAGLPATGEVDEATAEVLGEPAGAGDVPEWFQRPLRFGHHGRDVRALRRMLTLQDGETFNGTVELAVRQYQSAHQIPPTGIFTEQEAILLGDDVPWVTPTS